MIYIIDTGFGYVQHPLATLVYGTPSNGSHGEEMLAVVKHINPTEDIHLCDITRKPSNSTIFEVLNFIKRSGNTGAVICIAFSVYYNKMIDDLVTEMAKDYTFIVAGGNAQEQLCDRTPCSNDNVITVGSLNKSKERASHNSIGDITAWAPGTNINVLGRKINGSSIATAIFTGYYSKYGSLAQEIIHKDFDNLITCKF